MSEQETLPAHRIAGNTAEVSKIETGKEGLKLSTLEDMFRFAKYVAASGLAPKGMDKPETILVALQSGMEIGFSPMQALQNMTVINGKSNIYGDAGLALVRGKGLLEDMIEAWEGEIANGTRKVTVTLKRKGQTPIARTFGIDDAKRAGLWGKSGPWSQFPERMLRYRALAFALRDGFSDALKGVAIAEEDYTTTKARNITSEVQVSDPRALALAEPAQDKGAVEIIAPASNMSIVDEIRPLIENAKPTKLSKIAKAIGMEWDGFYDNWSNATPEQLATIKSMLA